MTLWTKLRNFYTQRVIFWYYCGWQYSEISRTRIPPPNNSNAQIKQNIEKEKDCNMFDLMQSLTSSMVAFSTIPLKSHVVLRNFGLKREGSQSEKCFFQQGLSDLMKLKRKDRVSTRAESSTAWSCCKPFQSLCSLDPSKCPVWATGYWWFRYCKNKLGFYL